MTSDSSLTRFIFDQLPIRGEFTHIGQAWRDILGKHNYPPPLKNMLGELVAAGALIAAMINPKSALTLQIQGSGAISLLVVECTGALKIRATAKWNGEIPHANPAELIGEGSFVITLDARDGSHPYQGIVPLEGDSVAAMLENYMTRSEQIETRLKLAADDACACGMLLQKLPEQESPDEDAWNRANHLAATLTRPELLQLPAMELLHRLYHQENIRVFDAQEIAFECRCSRESVTNILRMLGHDEVRDIIKEQGRVEFLCEFCNERYVFDPVDAEQVFVTTAQQAPASGVKH
ncbi:MAG: Hsp33 family molecular chaperone HslO [Methylobacillus sp.]|jgi:molecular chaperone Hsp33|nr:Hsp33 family molecular chaperone HslO [Methylobacillus sp.]